MHRDPSRDGLCGHRTLLEADRVDPLAFAQVADEPAVATAEINPPTAGQ